MTQESGKKSSVLVLHTDPSDNGEPSAYSEDDDTWRAFLENPLTAASKAMMSVSGDEDSANALGLLYDYYKVPRDKAAAGQSKVFTVDADSNKLNFMVPYQDSPLAMTTLRTVPLHTVVEGSPLPQDKKSVFSTTDSMVSIPASMFSSNLEGPLLSYHGGLPGANSSQSDGIIFSRQLNHGQFISRHQVPTPAPAYTEVGILSPPVFSRRHGPH
ncbi:grainyhead-like protein 1 homolog [Aplochiton taeniatus]